MNRFRVIANVAAIVAVVSVGFAVPVSAGSMAAVPLAAA